MKMCPKCWKAFIADTQLACAACADPIDESEDELFDLEIKKSIKTSVKPSTQKPSKVDFNNKTIKNRSIYLCFQGKQLVNEYDGGYIFAGLDPSIPHWRRLRDVKEGDLIFHASTQGILAISTANGKCFVSKRPREHYLANDRPDMEGLMVKLSYILLKNPILHCNYKSTIIELQGDTKGKGYPFNYKGGGNQGYLYNLNKELAKFFMNEILKVNPHLAGEDFVKELLL